MPTDSVVDPVGSLAANFPPIDPVALVPRADPFDDPAWIFEPKYDGFRGILYGSEQGCDIRVPPDLERRVRDLWSRVAEVLGGRTAILDGEIVSLDRQGKPVLQHLVRGEGYPAFAAYDLLWLDGTDLRDRPLSQRKERLAELLPVDTGPLYKVLTIEEHGRALFGAIKRMDLSGIVAKCRNDPYRPGIVWYEIRNPGRPHIDSASEIRRRPRSRHLSRDW